MSSLNKENFYEIDEGDSDDEIEEVAMTDYERRQMKQAMKESHRIFEEDRQEHQKVVVRHNLLMLGLNAN